MTTAQTEWIVWKIIKYKIAEHRKHNYNLTIVLTQSEREELKSSMNLLDITLDNAFGVRLRYDYSTD